MCCIKHVCVFINTNHCKKDTFMKEEKDILKKVGDRIKYYRSLHNISQTELAKRINISKSFLSRIENGKTDYNIYIFWKICIILEIKPFDLLIDL